ncbi:hypothetical protein Q9L42_000165 (plasmid) [Methylomarinum sp. Ch1-1]|uniref:Uncharacterized protein n=1 Tax=Methylomarinum roseum TaxID=3067653 RepID=A0AAU7NP59_9GAMM|nr:hypothetical protein [Methylomarinum sp. Ch1-1]MDP4523126.1 hypothetical protein [Methylomarinum sp. Ch1-1]
MSAKADGGIAFPVSIKQFSPAAGCFRQIQMAAGDTTACSTPSFGVSVSDALALYRYKGCKQGWLSGIKRILASAPIIGFISGTATFVEVWIEFLY